VRHTLVMMQSSLRSEKRLARESIYWCSISSPTGRVHPAQLPGELSSLLGWAPPIAAVIPFEYGVTQAQDAGLPRYPGEALAKAFARWSARCSRRFPSQTTRGRQFAQCFAPAQDPLYGLRRRHGWHFRTV
jgi:hypothetical protein